MFIVAWVESGSMIDRNTLKMAWDILDKQEKSKFWWVLLVVVISAISASFMVASVMPFLAVLSEPARIHKVTLLSKVYEWGGFQTDRSFLFALGIASIAVIIIANIIQIVRVRVVMRFALMRAHTISYRLLESYLRQPYEYFLVTNTGKMGTQILSESQQLVNQFFRPALEGFASLVTLTALLALILYVNPVVSLGVILFFGSIYGGTLLINQRIVKRLGIQRRKANTARHHIANEALGGIKDLRLLACEKAYLNRYSVPSQQMGESMVQVHSMQQTPQYIMQAGVFSGLIILCLMLLGFDSESQASKTDILTTIGVIALAGQRMMPELSRLYQSLNQLTYGGTVVRAVYRDMVAHRGGLELPDKPVLPLGLKQGMSFENISYYYDQTTKAGLSNVSFSIRAGERIGVVGTTGAGKSTLANILLGLIQSTEGRFIVDGKEITSINTRAWQRSIGYVPQEIYLVDASIRENIAFGIPPEDIDDNRVIQAASIAQLHEFIMKDLDKGYDTAVGERGVRLSGGQRQRIGIARALYNDGDLMVLDEATSALDNVTEAEVMRAIDNLPGSKTLIMIAHRLTTLRGCDRILVLDRGKIAAFSTWDELMQTDDTFQKMAQSAPDSESRASAGFSVQEKS